MSGEQVPTRASCLLRSGMPAATPQLRPPAQPERGRFSRCCRSLHAFRSRQTIPFGLPVYCWGHWNSRRHLAQRRTGLAGDDTTPPRPSLLRVTPATGNLRGVRHASYRGALERVALVVATTRRLRQAPSRQTAPRHNVLRRGIRMSEIHAEVHEMKTSGHYRIHAVRGSFLELCLPGG
jgi:hypothetical protein